jgi:hypothetical protein
MTSTTETDWLQTDGTPIACREKLRMLDDNDAELAQVMRDAFEDAILMGVDPVRMRAHLHAAIDRLQDPRRR